MGGVSMGKYNKKITPLRKKEGEKSEYWGWGGVGAAACTS